MLRKRVAIIAGDWNAEVESITVDREPSDAVGRYANARGNQRGDWLKRWATAERILLANTFFKKRWGQRWTHTQNGRQRQIDYILVDSKYRRLVREGNREKALNLGLDHRAIKVVLDLQGFKTTPKRRRAAAPKLQGWAPSDEAEYHQGLGARVMDIQRGVEVEQEAERLGAE